MFFPQLEIKFYPFNSL